MNKSTPISPNGSCWLQVAWYKLFLLVFAMACAVGSARATDLTVTGNLQVSGTSDFLNNTLTVGSLTGSGSASPGFTLQFVDTSGTNPAVIQMSASRTAQQWLWTQQTASGTAVPMLLLDANNKLELYSSGSTAPSIVLDPTAGKITINGQTIGGGSGIWNTSGSNTILSTGEVGIGTSSPDTALDVLTSSTSTAHFTSSSSSGQTFIKIDNTHNSQVGLLGVESSGEFLRHSSGSQLRIEQSNGTLGTLNSGTILINGGNTSSGNSFSVNGSADISGGVRLGSGTGAPLVTLDVRGGDAIFQDNSDFGSSTSHYLGRNQNVAYLGFGPESGFEGVEFGGPGSDAGGYVAFHTHHYLYSSGERMRIDSDGNVGINTSTPAAMLDVEGDGRFTGPVHLEPQGDLDMGEFTYDPNVDGDSDSEESMGGGGGSSMAHFGGRGGTILGGGGGGTIDSGTGVVSGTTASGTSIP